MSNNSSELETNFRTAALAVTNLYRTAQAEKLAAFDDGYASCFDDLLTFLTTVSPPPSSTTPSTTTAASDSTHLIDSLVSFFSAKQDVLNPAAAESLHNLVSTFKPQQPTHQQLEQQKEPPVFTFTATPQTGIASEFHKSHPILPFAARHRVFGLRSGGGGSVSSGGSIGVGGGAFLGGRRRGHYNNNGLSMNSSYGGGSNDLSAVFSGVDFSALGLGPISLSSDAAGDGAAIAAEGLSIRDASAASTPPIDSLDNKEGKQSSTCLFDASRGTAIPLASSPSATTTTLKRRWNGQTVPIDEMDQQQSSESYNEHEEGDDHLMMDDSEMSTKRVRWNSMTD
ncbi:UNVERIFIED_CONTAM: hypothetical protein HDU68_009697 [Siphonaria sp. JEL0065]|nr:hypothetical protein HDU68_009697 [Siphonaria sp. JEL0065]